MQARFLRPVLVIVLLAWLPTPATAADGDLVIPPVFGNTVPNVLGIVGSDQFVAYEVVRAGSEPQTIVIRRGDRRRTVLDGVRASMFPGSAAGPFLLVGGAAGPSLYDVRDSSLHPLKSAADRSEQVAVLADGGWVEFVRRAGGDRRDLVRHAQDGRILGRYATASNGGPGELQVDNRGALLSESDLSAGPASSAVTYLDFASGALRTLSTSATCGAAMTTNAFGWCERGRRVRVDRNDLHIVQTWDAAAMGGSVHVTPTATAWVEEAPDGYVVVTSPVGAGGRRHVTRTPQGRLATSGADVVVVGGGTPRDCGLYLVDPRRSGLGPVLDLPGAGAPMAMSASLGRVMYTELDGSPDTSEGSVHDVAVARSTTGLVAASNRVVLTGVHAAVIVSSGGLTAGHATSGRDNLVLVSNGSREVARRRMHGLVTSLAGHRVVSYREGAPGPDGRGTLGRSHVLDLRWDHAGDVEVDGKAVLSGSTLVRIAGDGSVLARDLDTGAADTVVRAPGGLPDQVRLNSSEVATDGTWVSWSMRDGGSRSLEAVVRRLDGSIERRLPPGVQDLRVSGGRAAWAAGDGEVHVMDLASGSTAVVGRRASYGTQSRATVALAPDLVAWTNPEGGTVVHAVELLSSLPRLLGGFVPKRFTRSPGLVIDLAVDRPVTHAELVVTGALGVVARSSSSAPRGDIHAVWDGRRADGTQADPGTYTWTLALAGSDGPVLPTASSPLTGTAVLDVTAPRLEVSVPEVLSDDSAVPRARLTWGSDDATARFEILDSHRVPGPGMIIWHWSPEWTWFLDEPRGSVVYGGPQSRHVPNPTSLERLRIRVYDEAGNSTGAVRDVLTPYDDRAEVLHYSTGWQRGSSPDSWAGTWTATTLRGRTVGASLRTSRVVVVGTTCPACGRFRLLIDGRVVKIVDTGAAATHLRQRLVDIGLPGPMARHGVQILTEGTAGRPTVQLDGIGLVQ
jgi:hypothetical protein